MEQTPAAPFSPLLLGNQIRRDFALHYAGESMAALDDLLARMAACPPAAGGTQRATRPLRAGEIPSEDLMDLLDEVTRVRGPYIHALPIPRMGGPWRTFAADAGLHPALVETLAELGFQRLYTHQEAAIRAILTGRHTLLSAATGRGKTEGWLLPILQRIVKDRIARPGGRRGGISALLMYPTKALAQDQLKRLLRYTFALNRRLARDGIAPITVGIWDGDTPRRAADNEDYYLSRTMELLPCPLHGPDCQHLKLSYLPDGRPVPAIRYERGHEDVSFEFVYLTKDDILAAPVDILLTNPDSINWRLFNVNALDELKLFVQQPRFIVFDEVHLYNSLFGAFVSALMKRYMRTRVALWAREGVERETVEQGIQFIAASATVANKEDLFRQICPLIGNLAVVEEEPRELKGTWPETLPALWTAGPLDEPGLLALAQKVAPPGALPPEKATLEHAYEAIASAIDRAPVILENDASVILRSDSDEESRATTTSGLRSTDSLLPSAPPECGPQNDSYLAGAGLQTEPPTADPLQTLRALHAALRHDPMTAQEVVALLQEHYPDLTARQAEQVLDNFYLLGQGTGILEDRVHLFAWPLEGLYACLACGRVYPAPTHHCTNPECGSRFVTRVTVCRDCGRLNLEGWFCPLCRQVHPLHVSVGGERTLQEWSCPVCEEPGTRVVWRPRYRCPRCGWMGKDRGGPQLACPQCASGLEPVGLDPQTKAVDLPVVCRREGCEAVHAGRAASGRASSGHTPARCTCGERILYYDALFDVHAVERCEDCRRLRERLPGAPCALPGHASHHVSHSLSSYVAVRPDRLIVRPLREAQGKAGCCPDGSPLKHRRFLGLSRSPDHLAVTLAQYLLRRIVQSHMGAGGPAHTATAR